MIMNGPFFSPALTFLLSAVIASAQGERTTVAPTHGCSRSGSARGPGIFSLPGVLCFILGALLFLVLVILGVQLHRGRAEHRASSAFEDVVDEALYQEIDNYAAPEKEDLVNSPGVLSDDAGMKLPYYTRDEEEQGDLGSAPEPAGQHVSATGDGYDEVEEFHVPEIPSSPGIRGYYFSSEEEGGAEFSQPGVSRQSPGEAAIPGMGERGCPLALRQDPGYDDVELSTT